MKEHIEGTIKHFNDTNYDFNDYDILARLLEMRKTLINRTLEETSITQVIVTIDDFPCWAIDREKAIDKLLG